MRNRLKISILYNKINLKISKIQILTNYINWIKRQLIKNNFQMPKICIIVINKRAVFFEIDATYDTFNCGLHYLSFDQLGTGAYVFIKRTDLPACTCKCCNLLLKDIVTYNYNLQVVDQFLTVLLLFCECLSE